MKRLTFTAMASALVLAIAPASALARHHSKRHHHKRVHHARVIHRRFGDINNPTTTPTTPTTPPPAAIGTVDSFTGGVLTIKLTDGTLVSGKVTSETEIECEAADRSTSTTTHDDGDGGGGQSGQGDQSGAEQNSGGTQSSGGDQSGGDQNSGGEDNGSGDDDAANSQSCGMAALTSSPPASVSGAELKLSSAGAVWEKVRLIG